MLIAEISAPGKLILCGEHAVVYGRPAIALPVHGIRAHASVRSGNTGSGVVFEAPDLGRTWSLADTPDDPLSQLVQAMLDTYQLAPPDLLLQIASDIPIASGMGSGAAIATIVVRAVAQALGISLAATEVSRFVYESEKRYHGTPSGIDNTVVAFEQPIWFIRAVESGMPQQPTITPIEIAAPFTLLVGDTGIRSATKLPVGDVRQRWQADPQHYEDLFNQVATCVYRVRDQLAQGDLAALGQLLSENHRLLQSIGVSSAELDRLVDAALRAGALGAKLSGAGWGGVMIALVLPEQAERVQQALVDAGAVRVLVTQAS
jgi:mevalonate kinase